MSANPFTSVAQIREDGFGGFVSIRELRESKLQNVPDEMGVYFILRLQDDIPAFLPQSTGGRFKDRDPSVPTEILISNWVSDTPVLYIGKAGGPDVAATLQSRLRQYLAFGAGRKIGHWGGRLIWHLPQSENLLVCWKRTPNAVPREIEQQLIRDFVAKFGKRPFANLTD